MSATRMPTMGPAMAGTELSSLPLAPSNRDRLLRAGFRTLRDVEGVQPLGLSRGRHIRLTIPPSLVCCILNPRIV